MNSTKDPPQPPDRASREPGDTISFGTGGAWRGRLGRERLAVVEASQAGRPERVGQVRIEGELGRGGMGDVYRGYDESLERVVAVKTIRAEHRLRPSSLERFRREARLLSRLNHPGICQVYELIQQEEADYLVMEFVAGRGLREVLDDDAIDDQKRLEIAERVAEALAVAHGRGVVHRDLKPENLIVTEDGSPKILDFGIARSVGELDALSDEETYKNAKTHDLTVQGTVVGTVPYMSPEQARAEAVTEASDVFSLGLILGELFSGQRSYPKGVARDQLLALVTSGSVQPPHGLGAELTELIRRMTKPEPELRPTAREVRDRLQWIRAKPQRRRRAVVRVLVAATILVIAGSFLFASFRLERQANLAQLVALEVKELESRMRSTYLLPAHDIRPEKEAALARLIELEQTVLEAGSVARGPGRLALAQGFLSVGEAERARRLMEDTWKSGYRPPEVSYTYGLALGQLLERDVGLWSSTPDAEQVRDHRELVRAQAGEVVRLLEMGVEEGVASGSLFPEYPRALLAFYSGRHDEALGLAREAAERASWLHQARVLEGQILKRMGEDLRDQGDYEESLALVHEARDAYRKAVAVGESDPAVHEALCDLSAREMQLVLYGRGGDLAAALAAATETCEQSLAIDESRASTHYVLSNVFYRWTEAQDLRGLPADAELSKSIKHARRAVELEPAFDLAHAQLGTALYRSARQLTRAGEDPFARLEAAVAAVRRASVLNPARAEHGNWLGLIQHYWAQQLITNGSDPMQMFDAAEQSYQAASELAQQSTYVYNNLGRLRIRRARYERGQGRDERATLQRAIEALDRSTEINPSNSFALNNLGDAWIAIGRASAIRGEDPETALRSALDRFRQSLEVRPDYASPLNNVGLALWRLGRWQSLNGQDVSWLFDEARSSVTQAAELAPGAFQPRVNLGRIDCLEADSKRRSGIDPEPSVLLGLAHYAKALELSPTYDVARVEAGRCALIAASASLTRSNQETDPWLAMAKDFGTAASDGVAVRTARLLLARVHLEQAMRLIAAGLDPSAEFASARLNQVAALEAEGAKGDVAVYLEAAQLALAEAEWRHKSGLDPEVAAKRGRAHITRALEIHPDHPEALRVRTTLARSFPQGLDV